MPANVNKNFKNKNHRTNHSLMSDINVTPLVDVMLVLLVVFMITAPLLTSGVNVNLPQSEAPSLPGNEEPLIIAIDAKGNIYLSDNITEKAKLTEQLKAITGANPDIKIFVKGDSDVNYGIVMDIMGHITNAGYNKVALITQPLNKK